MKAKAVVVLAGLCFALWGYASAAPIERELGSGVKLEAAGKPIDVQVGHLVPCVADWNGDGRKDLLVGQFVGGKIALYLNEGTDKAPKFGSGRFLEAGGKEISLPAG
jgi:hypothetical protein